MDVKKKRIRVIKWTLAIAVFLPILLSPLTVPPKGEPPLYIVHLFFFIPSLIATLLHDLTDSPVVIIMGFAITHVLVFFIIGWIIARLVYMNKKTASKSEPAQD